jgi:ubiquinone/menaquinone biosynthesis C-methylase UbiE
MDRYLVTKNTYDKIAGLYAERGSSRGLDTKYADIFIEKLRGKGNRILDIGCADGKYSKYFASKGFQVTGVDFSPEMINLARRNVPETRFLEMDMLNLKIDDKFDGILAAASLLHVQRNDIEKVLRLFFKLLSSSGELYISIIEGNNEILVQTSAGIKGERLFVYFSKIEIKSLLEKVGFKEIEINEQEYLGANWLHIFARR